MARHGMGAGVLFAPAQTLHQLLNAGAPTGQMERALEVCWHQLAVEQGSGMQAYKLLNRMNNVRWDDPILTFTIDRHGAMVAGGSIYTEVQEWTVDLNTMTAHYRQAGRRQHYAKAASIKVGPIAEEIATAVLAHEEHPYLTWAKNGSVKVHTSFLGGVKQTFDGRRKRLNKALTPLLNGWSRSGAYWRKEAA